MTKEERAAINKKWRANHPNYLKEWRLKNRTRTAIYNAKHREQQNAAMRRWHKNNPTYGRDYKRKMSKIFPEKYKARAAVCYAIRKRRLIRPKSCSICGIKCKPDAHHHRGYELLLDVVWLCHGCHMKLHKFTVPA